MSCVVTADVVKLCPFRREVDHGRVWFEFDRDAPELHDLAEYLGGLTDALLSHEEYTRLLRSEIGGRVTTTWRTAGLDITCTEG